VEEVYMQLAFSKRSAASVAVLVTALATFVGASVGSAASTKNVPIPPDPIKTTLAKVKGLTIKGGFPNNPRDTKLRAINIASEGATINVYSSLSSFITKPLTDLWKATFPDITLNFYRGASEDVSARFLAESATGTKGADVVESNGTTMLIFQHNRNLLVPYRGSPYAAQIPKQYRFDTFTSARLEEFVVAWNTNLVTDPPKTFQDLADPKWKGKLALEPTDTDWFATLETYLMSDAAKPKLTQAQADDLLKKIAANSQLIPGHSAEASALAAGQISVIVSGHGQSIEQLQAKKAPITFGPPFVTPVIERPQGMGISYLAPHPAGALLFYDFLISPLGQKMLQQNGVVPANPYFPDASFASHPFTVKMDIRPIVGNWVAWNKKFNAIVQP
jgi:iron(III) transport system substrate-binding protein